MEIAHAIPTLPQPRRRRDYSLNPYAYGVRILRARSDAFAPPSLRIDIQRDTARAASVPHVVTCNFETSAKASHQASVLGPKAAEVEGCRYSKFPGRCFRMSMKQVMPVERLANFVGKDQVIRLTEFLVAYLQEGWS